MKPFILGMIIGWVVLPLAGLLYLRFGYVPVAVDGPVIPFEELLAGTAVQARIAKQAPTKEGLPASEENIVAGARLYRERCVTCHGLPGSTITAEAKGMFPPPPQFFEQRVVGNEPVGQNYWIISNGIRLSGMPGYKGALSDEQMWQISQFLLKRGGLPDAARAALASAR